MNNICAWKRCRHAKESHHAGTGQCLCYGCECLGYADPDRKTSSCQRLKGSDVVVSLYIANEPYAVSDIINVAKHLRTMPGDAVANEYSVMVGIVPPVDIFIEWDLAARWVCDACNGTGDKQPHGVLGEADEKCVECKGTGVEK